MSSKVVQLTSAKPERVYLSHNDLLLGYTWAGATLGFDYQVDAAHLETALQAVLRSLPVLGGRLKQTKEGRYFINCAGDEGQQSGVSYAVTRIQDLKVSDLPGAYVNSRVSDTVPSNRLVPELIPQMQPHLFLTGKEPLLNLQLSQLNDGCVLGISFAHVLTDMTGLGSVLADLSLAYQGGPLADRPAERLAMIRAECKAAGHKGNDQMSDKEALTGSPCVEAPPKDFAECVATQAYSVAGPSAEERAAGASHSAQVLHIPGTTLQKVREQVLASQIAVKGNITMLSVNDITMAVLWIIREVSEGNTLAGGLQKCLTSAMELRRNFGFQDSRYFGNAFKPRVIMPAAIKPTSHANRYAEVLLAAACASRQSLDALRADPDGIDGDLRMIVASVQAGAIKQGLAAPDFHPFRDCALAVTSWRKLGLEGMDFGQGRAKMILGDEVPIQHRFANITEGPVGDGVFCLIRFPGDGFVKLHDSGVLAEIAPGAAFGSPLQRQL